MKLLFNNILKPDFVLPFGVNRGYSLSEIYQYLPTYIEWLIANILSFEIDITNFEKLPTPTIYSESVDQQSSFESYFKHKNSNQIIKNSEKLMTCNFRFSEKTKNILLQKKLGTYVPDSSRFYFIKFHINMKQLSDYDQNTLDLY